MSLELAPLPPSPSVRKRRRRHLIVDENIMISKAEMKRNLQTGSDLCKPLVSLKQHGHNFFFSVLMLQYGIFDRQPKEL